MCERERERTHLIISKEETSYTLYHFVGSLKKSFTFASYSHKLTKKNSNLTATAAIFRVMR